MKITIEFDHPCELIDLMRKMSDVMVADEPVDADYLKSCQDGYQQLKKMIDENDSGVVKINKPNRYNNEFDLTSTPAMSTQFDETPISHDHTKAE